MVKCKWKHCDNFVKENTYRGHTPVFCSKKCKNKSGVDTLRTKRKQDLVNYLGGKCSFCGYKKSLAALHFHHLYDKKFNVNKGITLSFDVVKHEVDKCILLCSNCHAELHYEFDS